MIILTLLFILPIVPSQAGWQPDINYCRLIDEQPEDSCRHDGFFKAGVFEHNRIDLGSGLETAEANLRVFEEVAKLAGNYSINVLVFPEDGLFVGPQEFMAPVIEEIPDPKVLKSDHNNPCLKPELFKHLPTLSRFSCMARDNHLYVVANYGTKQSCRPKERVQDAICPDGGFFVLNTDIVIDEEGNYIGRYRKYNLFIEEFHKAPSLEYLFFDSSYGRFGVFTCFDMMFKRPAIDLVEKFHIDTAIFPTWWYDELPLLTAIQFQDAWSWSNKVNLLASNIHRRNLGSVGSSIFSGYDSVYTNPETVESKLLVATLPRKPRAFDLGEASGHFDSEKIVVEQRESPEYRFKHYSLLENDTIQSLSLASGSIRECAGKFCCHLNYRTIQDTQPEHLSKMVLLVRDGPRKGHYNWYEQTCALVTLDKPLDREDLNGTTFSSKTMVKFEELSLEGTFETKYIFPVAAYNVSQLVQRDRRQLNCDQAHLCRLEFTGSHAEIYSFGLYGRIYERDQMPEGW